MQILLYNFLTFQWDTSDLLALEFKKLYFYFSSVMASALYSSLCVWAWMSTAATSSPHLSLPEYPGVGMGIIKLHLGCSSPSLVCKGMMGHCPWPDPGHGSRADGTSRAHGQNLLPFLRKGRCCMQCPVFSVFFPSMAQRVLRQGWKQCSISISFKKQWCQSPF